MSEYVLEMHNINKSFAAVKALKDVKLELKKGEILALVGENGAGKSTLMKILTGVYTADSGSVIFEGKPVVYKGGTKDIQELGISIMHQELNLMQHLTVAQNIYIGRESDGFILNDKEINTKTQKIFDSLHLNISPTEAVKNLTVGKQQMVEIAKAISFNSKILILDEPTAALTESEIEELFIQMRRLQEQGVSMIYISHRMDEIMRMTDRISVMRDAEYIDTLVTKDTNLDEIISLMVGRVVYEKPKTQSTVKPDAPVVLEVRDLKSPEVFGVSFQLHEGEILGFAGLMGAGRTETARLIFGADKKISGEIYINGKLTEIKTPQDAVKAGIGYLSEDRKRFGLSVQLTVKDNTVLASLEKFCSCGIVNDKKCAKETEILKEKLRVKTPSIYQQIRNLSGGNQQKVILAKWLLRDCDILIFDEPTRGIDIGAKNEIYKLMNELAADGKAIIMISSELEEVMRMSDRVVCMCEGRQTAILPIEEASQETIMKYATLREKKVS